MKMAERRDAHLFFIFQIIINVVAVLAKESFPVLTKPSVVLYKGAVGVLPCRFQRHVYYVWWFKGDSQETAEDLVSLDMYYAKGRRVGPGYERRQFNITDDFSLIINDVHIEHEGRYFCKVLDYATQMAFNNYTDVTVISIASKPTIQQCDHISDSIQPAAPDHCVYNASSHWPNVTLTCALRGFRPNVSLTWGTSGLALIPLDSSQTLLSDGTYERNVTIIAEARKERQQNFTCTAEGLAVNGSVSKSITIHYPPVTETTPRTTSDDRWVVAVAAVCIESAFVMIFLILVLRRRRATHRITKDHESSLVPLLNGRPEKSDLMTAAWKALGDSLYDTIASLMTNIVEMGYRLSPHERELLFMSRYMMVSERRSCMNDPEAEIDSQNSKIKEELEDICKGVLELLSKYLIVPMTHQTTVEDVEDHVFYLTMQGDYLRYIAEIKSGKEENNFMEEALSVYHEAMELSSDSLPPSHPTRLGVIVSISVLFCITGEGEKALDVIRKAITNTEDDTDNLDEDLCKHSELIKQHLTKIQKVLSDSLL